MLTARDYKDALEVFENGPCNVSGIVHSLSDVMTKIWAEANKGGKGTTWVNTHPIVLLYLSQLNHLAHGCTLEIRYAGDGDDEDYTDTEGYEATMVNAHQYCMDMAERKDMQLRAAVEEIKDVNGI